MGRNSAPRSPCEPVRVWDPIRVPCAPGKHLPGMEIKEEMLMKKRFVALLLCLVMVVGLIPAAMAAGPEGDEITSHSKRTMEATEVPVKDCSNSQRVTLQLARSRSVRMTLTEMATPSSAGAPNPTARRSITTARLFPLPNCSADAPTLFCTLSGKRTA